MSVDPERWTDKLIYAASVQRLTGPRAGETTHVHLAQRPKHRAKNIPGPIVLFRFDGNHYTISPQQALQLARALIEQAGVCVALHTSATPPNEGESP